MTATAEKWFVVCVKDARGYTKGRPMTGWEPTGEDATAKAAAMSDMYPGSFVAMPEKDFYASIDDESVLDKYLSPAAGETPTGEISFRQVVEHLKYRYGNVDRLSLYEAANAKYWGIDQLADAIVYDGLSLDAPMFRIDRDTIHEQFTFDGMEYNFAYTVKICAPEVPADDPRSFRIAYRTGGTENFKWVCVLGFFSGEGLRENRAEIERMGYPTIALAAGETPPNVYGVELWDDNRFRRIRDNGE